MIRDTFRVVVGALIYNSEGKFLLAQRYEKDTNLPGIWAIPAGHAEEVLNSLDSLEENLRREVREEIGVEINIEKYFDSHSWVTDEYKKITIIFLCTIASGEPQKLEETADLAWVSVSDLPNYKLAPNIERLITKADKFLQSRGW